MCFLSYVCLLHFISPLMSHANQAHGSSRSTTRPCLLSLHRSLHCTTHSNQTIWLTRLFLPIIRPNLHIQMFLKEKAEQRLEVKRSDVLLQAALTIQRHVRGHLQRRRLHLQRSAAVRLQSAYRAYRVRRHYRQLYDAVIVAQSIWRMRMQRRRYLQMRAMLMQKRAMESALRKRSSQESLVHHSSSSSSKSKSDQSLKSNAVDQSSLLCASNGITNDTSNRRFASGRSSQPDDRPVPSHPHSSRTQTAPSVPVEDLTDQLQRLHLFCQGNWICFFF